MLVSNFEICHAPLSTQTKHQAWASYFFISAMLWNHFKSMVNLDFIYRHVINCLLDIFVACWNNYFIFAML